MLKVEVVLRNPKMAVAILVRKAKALITRVSGLEVSAQHSQQEVTCKKKEEEDPLPAPRVTYSLHTLITWTR